MEQVDMPERCKDILNRKRADEIQIGGDHYKTMAIEPWEVMRHVLSPEEFVGFLKGNIIKYGMRQGRKSDGSDDGVKAKHYAQKLSEIQDGLRDFNNAFAPGGSPVFTEKTK